jgi:hypothetical protein
MPLISKALYLTHARAKYEFLFLVNFTLHFHYIYITLHLHHIYITFTLHYIALHLHLHYIHGSLKT